MLPYEETITSHCETSCIARGRRYQSTSATTRIEFEPEADCSALWSTRFWSRDTGHGQVSQINPLFVVSNHDSCPINLKVRTSVLSLAALPIPTS